MRKISLLILVIMIITSFIGCKEKNEYADDSLRVYIKSNYKNKFLDETLDLKYDNIKNFDYSELFEDSDFCGYVYVNFKKTGENELKKAIEYFQSLDFVDHCEKIKFSWFYKMS